MCCSITAAKGLIIQAPVPKKQAYYEVCQFPVNYELVMFIVQAPKIELLFKIRVSVKEFSYSLSH